MTPRLWAMGLGLALVNLQTGCALTSKAEALSPRYFSPEQPPLSVASPLEKDLALRLDQVASAQYLDERISYRLSGSEVGFYDNRRWTEVPEAYLRRALERELFERRGLQRVVTGSGPSLSVELTAFEEIRGEPTRARVTLIFNLRDERGSLIDKTLTLERELIAPKGADAEQRLATTLAATLADAVARVGTEVVQKLKRAKEEAEL